MDKALAALATKYDNLLLSVTSGQQYADDQTGESTASNQHNGDYNPQKWANISYLSKKK